MSDPVIIAIISAIPPTFVALLALLRSMKVEKAVQEVHLSINSRMDKFIEITKTVSHAEGVKEQKDKQSREANGTD